MESDMHKRFLRDMRRAKSMTQAHLALAAEISERTVQRAERGETVAHDSLRAICSVLGLDASGLVGRLDTEIPSVTFNETWTGERHAEAVSLWMEGNSGEDISTVFGEPFTKNKVICRMFLAGLAFSGGSREGRYPSP